MSVKQRVRVPQSMVVFRRRELDLGVQESDFSAEPYLCANEVLGHSDGRSELCSRKPECGSPSIE